MAEYLSKEEIRQWRSSLEKITLEDFATRLGKVINEEKETRDIVDIVMKNNQVLVKENYRIKAEKIYPLAQKALQREKEIQQSVIAEKVEQPKAVEPKSEKQIVSSENLVREKEIAKKELNEISQKVNYSFKKALTDREQLVFEHFAANTNQIVYARDLAKLLDLPRDYVYKYIKNLRNKIKEDVLENADNGGYILKA